MATFAVSKHYAIHASYQNLNKFTSCHASLLSTVSLSIHVLPAQRFPTHKALGTVKMKFPVSHPFIHAFCTHRKQSKFMFESSITSQTATHKK